MTVETSGTRKLAWIIAGGLAGAFGAAVFVTVEYFSMVTPPNTSLDFATPMVALLSAGIAGVIGALAGGYAAERFAAGRPHDWKLGSGLLAAIVLTPAAVHTAIFVVLPNLPARSSPATRSEVRQWQRNIGAPNPGIGRQLAYEVASCAERYGLQLYDENAGRGCPSLAQTRGDKPHQLQYLAGDNGWRWVTKPAPDDRVEIYADPLLGGTPPIFEVWKSLVIVTRERKDAPAFLLKTYLPIVQRYRDCVAATAAAGLEDGSWSGEWRPLANLTESSAACQGLRVHVDEVNSSGRQIVEVMPPDVDGWVRMSYRAAPVREGGFEIFYNGQQRRYMIDRDGRWHVTTRTPSPSVADPSPLACELDLSVPCGQ